MKSRKTTSRAGSRKRKTKKTDDVPTLPSLLTLAQAWHVVALANMERGGICQIVDEMESRGLIDYARVSEMNRAVDALSDHPGEGGFKWPLVTDALKPDEPRIKFANQMAGYADPFDDEPEEEPEPRADHSADDCDEVPE